MSLGGVPVASWIAPAAVSLLTVVASRRAGAAWWSAWVAGLVTALGLAAVVLAADVTDSPVSALGPVVESLGWAVATVAVVAAFAVAAGGPATSPVGVIGVTVAGLLAVYLEASAAVVLPGLLLCVLAMADERSRGAAVAAVLSTGAVLVGVFVGLVAAGRLPWPGGPAVDPPLQGPVALLAIPGLLTVVTAVLAVQLAERADRTPEPDSTYRARRTIP